MSHKININHKGRVQIVPTLYLRLLILNLGKHILMNNNVIIEKCKRCKYKNKWGDHSSYCKKCNPNLKKQTFSQKEKKRLYRQRPDVKIRERKSFLERFLKRKYKISLNEYNEMLIKQNYVCFICQKKNTKKDHRTQKTQTLHVDHCHANGKVRGLLCSKCNLGLGTFNDDVKLLQKSIEYLTSNGR